MKALFTKYTNELTRALVSVNVDALEAAAVVMSEARTVYVAGNGGSAAIANHLCCDITKGTSVPEFGNIETVSLVSNPSMLTAIGNDIGYEDTISYQLPACTENTVLVLISSSGHSSNIIKAARVGRNSGMFVIGLTGFDGGTLKEMVNISIHVPTTSYGVAEDAHQVIMHAIAERIKELRK